MNIFEVEEHIAKATLKGTTALIYGKRKIGKTTLASKYPRPFIIGFEIGWKGLNKVKAAPVKDWNQFKRDFVKPLIKDAKDAEKEGKEKHFETLIIDTTDIAWDYCVNYICSQEGVTHLDYTENKRGYKMVKHEFLKQMFALLAAGYTIVFTSHAETKQTVDEITREKVERTIPTMDKNAFKIIGGVVDMIIYCGAVETEEGQKRGAYFRSNGVFEAGSRWSEHLPVAVPLDFKSFEEAIITAIEKKAEEDGVSTDSKQEESIYSVAEQTIDYDYDEMMEEVNEIGTFLHESGRLDIMTEVSDELLGVGKKLSQCTKLQTEAIHAVLTEVKGKMEEEGLKIQ